MNRLKIINITLGLIWIYQGLIPKIMYPNKVEVQLLENAFPLPEQGLTLIYFAGAFEILLGVLFLIKPNKLVHYLSISLLIALALMSLVTSRESFVQPFNPFSLNVSLIVLSVLYFIENNTYEK